MSESVFKSAINEVLGTYLTSHEDATFAVLSDGYHFDCWGWMVTYYTPTGLWNFSAGRGVTGVGKSISDAMTSEMRKYRE